MNSQVKAAPEPPPAVPLKAFVACVAAWLVPGSGHVILGRPGRAAAFCLLVLLTAGTGFWLDGKLFVPVGDQPLSMLGTIGSMAMGIPYFILRFVMQYEGSLVSASYEYGSAFMLTAGLMNFMLVLDAWDIGRGFKD